MNFKKALPWYLLALVIIVIDQITKAWADSNLMFNQIEVTSFFNLTLAYNKGAAFSFLHDAGGWQRWLFSGLSLAVSVVLTIWISRLSKQERLLSLALSLILAGALGNLYDRVMLGHVIDFLDFHWGGKHFPAFNIADSAITVGAILLAWESLFAKKPEADSKGSAVNE